MRDATTPVPPVHSIGYVLKGFPRLSELFITSEIHRLERAGLTLRLFVIKPAEEPKAFSHPLVSRLRAKPEYLPPTSSVSAVPLRRWLAQHLGRFSPALRRVVRRRPVGVARAAAEAFAQAIRARRSFFAWPRKVYAKEFLQAVALSDRLLDAPDVAHLHAHFCHGATTVAWLASIITGVPFSFTAHAKDLYCDSLNPAGLLRRKLAAARFAVTCTEANRQHLLPLANGTPVHRVYHGLNAELSRFVTDQSTPVPARNGTLRLLAVGRLVPKKGFDVLVDACEIVARHGVPYSALIVGEEGEHSGEIRRRIAAHGLSGRVIVRGAMDQASLFHEYRRATVFCLPCRIDTDGDRDGIPNVLMEAMACGVPVVTTAVSGIPELVRDGVSGVLVPSDDPEAVARAIINLYLRRDVASRLAGEARRVVREQFDGDKLAADLAAVFRQAVA